MKRGRESHGRIYSSSVSSTLEYYRPLPAVGAECAEATLLAARAVIAGYMLYHAGDGRAHAIQLRAQPASAVVTATKPIVDRSGQRELISFFPAEVGANSPRSAPDGRAALHGDLDAVFPGPRNGPTTYTAGATRLRDAAVLHSGAHADWKRWERSFSSVRAFARAQHCSILELQDRSRDLWSPWRCS